MMKEIITNKCCLTTCNITEEETSNTAMRLGYQTKDKLKDWKIFK
jgi:hypothetical protein